MILLSDAPNLLPVLALPFGALLLCVGVSAAVYIVWGRLKRTDQ